MLVDLEEGEARQEVDLPDLDAARDTLVDQLNELIGEHAVQLTEVDEETLHPLLGDGIALVALLALTVALQAAALIGLLDGLLLLIVVEHTAELEEHHALE